MKFNDCKLLITNGNFGGLNAYWAIVRNFCPKSTELSVCIADMLNISSNFAEKFSRTISMRTVSNFSLGLQMTSNNMDFDEIIANVRLMNAGQPFYELEKHAKYEVKKFMESIGCYRNKPYDNESSNALIQSYVNCTQGILSTLVFDNLRKMQSEVMRPISNDLLTFSYKWYQEKKHRDQNDNEPCSSAIIMHWIEQQRLNSYLRSDNDTTFSSRALLDLNYCGREAADDKPTYLLDKNLGKQETDYDRNVCSSTVMVTAVRAAAALKLPINISAVVSLNDPPESNVTELTEDTDMIVLEITYEPRSISDIAAMGIKSTVALIFNIHYRVWRFFHLGVDASPMWSVMPIAQISSDNIGEVSLQEECCCLPCMNASSTDLTDLGELSDFQINPYLIWQDKQGQPKRTLIRFLQQIENEERDADE